MTPAFVHLRMHSEYTVTDGIVRLDEAVERAAADGMPALAVTDLANLFGMVKFYKAARAKGVKPVIGCDVWITNEAERELATKVSKLDDVLSVLREKLRFGQALSGDELEGALV